MNPFLLSAFLIEGIVMDTRIGIALDSLLASEIRRKEKQLKGISGQELDGGLSRMDNTIKTVELPLLKCENKEGWHWLATCGVPVNLDNTLLPSSLPQVQSIIQARDDRKQEQHVSYLAKSISDTSGRWRGRRIPIPVTTAPKILWSGVGDVPSVLNLVKGIQSIGQRRRAGIGSILRWEIEELDSSPNHAGHLNPASDRPMIARPCYSSCMESLPVPFTEVYSTVGGVRPPYWHQSTQDSVYLPHSRETQ